MTLDDRFSEALAYTFPDVCGVPSNDVMRTELYAVADQDELQELGSLDNEYQKALMESRTAAAADVSGPELTRFRTLTREAYEAFRKCEKDLLRKYGEALEPVQSRDDIDLTPRGDMGSIPYIIANMHAIGLRATLAGARYGATTVVMQDNDQEEMYAKARLYADKMRNAHPWQRECCVMTGDASLGDLMQILQKYEDPYAMVVEGSRSDFRRDAPLIGLVGPYEVAKAKGHEEARLRRIMLPANDIVTAQPGVELNAALKILSDMENTRNKILPIMEDGHVVGVTSYSSVGYHLRFPPHMDSERGGLAYMLGMSPSKTSKAFAERLIQERLVGKGIVLDQAHFDRGEKPYAFLEDVEELIAKHDPTLSIVAGNVVTPEAALRIAECCGNTSRLKIKVGVGPAPRCTTRVIAGHGVPQVTAVKEIRDALDEHGYDQVCVIADGGIDTPGDLVTVIRSGADFGMGATSPAKTHESSPIIKNFGEPGKEMVWHCGSASGAVQLQPGARGQDTVGKIYRRTGKARSEGEEGYVMMRPEFRTIQGYFRYMMDGLTAGTSYAGGSKLEHLRTMGKSRVQTNAGFAEGKSRDK